MHQERLPDFALPVMRLLLIVAGLAAYHNSFSGSFILDDIGHIKNNRRIESFKLSSLISGQSRPVVEVSLAVNYAIGKLDVRGYHVFNVMVHLFAGLFLFGLVRRTMQLETTGSNGKSAGHYGQRRSAWLALAVALVWLVHPLQTQSVDYVIQRSESMMGLFALACLYGLVRGSQSERPWPWYVLAAVACWLGMGSKQVMVAVPLVVLLYDRVFLAPSWWETFSRRWAFYVFGLVPAWVWLIDRSAAAATGGSSAGFAMDGPSAGFATSGVTPVEYALSQPGVILHYLGLVFWPGRLCLDYNWLPAESLWFMIVTSLAVAVLVGSSLWAVVYRPTVGFLGLSFFLILAPTSSVMPIKDLAVEHRMYLPLAALVVLVVLAVEGGLDWLFSRFKWTPSKQVVVRGACVLGVVLGLSARTIWRNEDYRTAKSIWKSVVEIRPENPQAWFSLGRALEPQYDQEPNVDEPQDSQEPEAWDAAIKCYQESLKILESGQRNLRPRLVHMTHSSLGNNFLEQGKIFGRQKKFDAGRQRIETAIVHLQAAIDHSQGIMESYYYDLGVAYRTLGTTYFGLGRFDGAIESYLKSLGQLDNVQAPNHSLGAVESRLKTRHYLGMAYAQIGNVEEVLRNFEEVLQYNENLWPVVLEVAWIRATHQDENIRDGEAAMDYAKKMCKEFKFADPRALDVLAAAYAELGAIDEAAKWAEEAFKLATEAEQAKLAETIKKHWDTYKAGKPVRQAECYYK